MHKPQIFPEVVARAVARRGSIHVFDRFDPARTAHVVVDMQNGFMARGEVAEIDTAREVVPNVNCISAALRERGGLVAYIQNTFDEEVVRSWGVSFDHFCSTGRRERMIAAFTPGAFEHALWEAWTCNRRTFPCANAASALLHPLRPTCTRYCRPMQSTR